MVKKPSNTLGTPFTKFLLLFAITLKLSKSIIWEELFSKQLG
jgi:hypothetical protein